MKMRKLAFNVTLAAYSAIGLSSSAFAAAEKDFVWYCESDEATAEQKKTVDGIYANARLNKQNTSCKAAFDNIQAREDFGIHWTWNADIIFEDLAPLTGLTNLTYFICDSVCTAESVKTLPHLPELTELGLKHMDLAEFPKIDMFPKLNYLVLLGNSFSSVTNVPALKNIETFNIDNTKVTDLSFTKEMPKLKILSIDGIDKPAFETLPHLPNLSGISARYLELSNFDFLDKLPNAISLDVSRNEFTNIQGIHQHQQIKYLTISNNAIKNIPAKVLPSGLKGLSADKVPFESLEFLRDLKEIEYLHLDGSNFIDWSLIDHLKPTLEQLIIENNPIGEKVIPEGTVEHWEKLSSIWMAGTNIKSLAFFKQIKAPNFIDWVRFFPPFSRDERTEENCPKTGVPLAIADFCSM